MHVPKMNEEPRCGPLVSNLDQSILVTGILSSMAVRLIN